MFVWESKGDRLARAQRDLNRDLEQALLEQQFASAQSEVVHTRSALTSVTRANEKLVNSNAEMSQTIADLRREKEAAVARADAMDAAMHEKGIDQLVDHLVVLHTSHEHSIEGVLTHVYPDAVVLKHAFYIQATDGSRQAISGEITVPRPFEFVQELSRDAGAQDS